MRWAPRAWPRSAAWRRRRSGSQPRPTRSWSRWALCPGHGFSWTDSQLLLYQELMLLGSAPVAALAAACVAEPARLDWLSWRLRLLARSMRWLRRCMAAPELSFPYAHGGPLRPPR